MRLIVPGERVVVTNRLRTYYEADGCEPPYELDCPFVAALDRSWSFWGSLSVLTGLSEIDVKAATGSGRLDRMLWKGGWPQCE